MLVCELCWIVGLGRGRSQKEWAEEATTILTYVSICFLRGWARGVDRSSKLTLCDCLNERSEDEGQVVSRFESMPKGTCDKSRHTGPEAGSLPLRSNSQVHVISQPVVGVDIPISKISSRILRQFDADWVHILKSIPIRATCAWIDSFVTNARKNA